MAEERRVEAGQRVHGALSYRTVNTMIELVRQQRLQRLGPQGGGAQDSTISGGLEVFVQNLTGQFQPPGSILAIDQGTPLDPAGDAGEFVQRPCFSGAVPSSASDVVCVLRDGAADGEVSLAVLRGLAVVALDVTDATHGFAVPVAGDSSQMTSSAAGHPILWAETGDVGAQQGVVLLDALPGGVAGALAGEVWASGAFLSTTDAAVAHLGVEINRGLTSYHGGAGKFVIDANLLDWQDGDARGMLDNDDQIISGDKYVTVGTAFGEGLGLWGVRTPYLAGPPVTYYETSAVSAAAQHGAVVSHTVLASGFNAAGADRDNHSARGAYTSVVEWFVGHTGSRTTAGAEIAAVASVPLAAGGYYSFCDGYQTAAGITNVPADGIYSCRFQVLQDGTARLFHDGGFGTAYCVQDGAGALNVGGTATTGGAVFKGGLYISGSITAGGITVGTTAVTGGSTFGVLFNNGGVVGSVAPASPGQLLVSGSLAWVTMSGDATIDAAGALTLATSGVTAATYGDATHVAQIAVDAKGRITSASNVAITFPSSYTDEQAQDAVGTILTNSDTIAWTYNDPANTISAAARCQQSITSDASGVKLSGDAATPGNYYVYGTDGAGGKGWQNFATVSGAAARVEGSVAATGTNQGTAAAVTFDSGEVTGADGTKGVILDAAKPGSITVVWNSHAINSVKVYPPSGAKIGPVATVNIPDVLGATSVRMYCRVSSAQWASVTLN